jgi:hypothetical protein
LIYSSGLTDTVLLDQVDVNAEWLAVREGHTLRRLSPLSFSACAATVDLTDVDKLTTGDFQTGVAFQDNLVDITDFSILAAAWLDPIDATLSTGADATGDGVQGTGDFVAMQLNFLTVGDPEDSCVVTASRGGGRTVTVIGVGRRPVPVQPASQVAVWVDDLAIIGAEAADVTGDGIVDAHDIRAFARLYDLPLLPAFDGVLRELEGTKVRRIRR